MFDFLLQNKTDDIFNLFYINKMSYYKEIDGIKYDKAILDIADEQIKGRGDGRLSEDDMTLIIKSVIDRKKITKTEYLTIFYLIKNYNITEKALDSLAEGCS